MHTPARNSGNTRLAILGLILLAVMAAAIAVYVYPTQESITFVIRTTSGQHAEVLLNGEKVGQTPLELSYEELQQRLLPELSPAQWPPEGYRSASTRLDDAGSRIETGVLLSPTDQPDQIYLVRETDAGQFIFAGGVRLRVVAADGRIGVNDNVSILTQSTFKSRKITFEWKITLSPPK